MPASVPPEPPRFSRDKSFDPQSVQRALALSPKAPRPPATIRDDGAFDPGEDGEPTGAVYGFARKLLSVIKEYQPEYVAVAFDLGDTWSSADVEPYKATRDIMPSEMRSQSTRIVGNTLAVTPARAAAGRSILAWVGFLRPRSSASIAAYA